MTLDLDKQELLAKTGRHMTPPTALALITQARETERLRVQNGKLRRALELLDVDNSILRLAREALKETGND